MTWLGKIRLRVLAYVLGIALAVLGVVSLTTIPAWPIVGAAVAVVAMVIHRAGAGLASASCLGCGQSLSQQPEGEHGIICPECGTITRTNDEIA